jgi:hypothetical protein
VSRTIDDIAARHAKSARRLVPRITFGSIGTVFVETPGRRRVGDLSEPVRTYLNGVTSKKRRRD